MLDILKKPTATAITIATLFVRLVPHPPNMTPLGASALFGGAKLARPWNYVLPMATLFVTDIFLGFHSTMPFVYVSFVATVAIGEWALKKQASTKTLIASAIASSLLFFIVTNFGVWAVGKLYPQTVFGLWESYIAGLPFLRNMLIGDVLYTVGFFSLYKLAENNLVIEKIDNKLVGWLGKI
jgi:hypothetical protein